MLQKQNDETKNMQLRLIETLESNYLKKKLENFK